ncbi:MAG: hypothetical protein M1455_06260 [Actinobacteria bacterium]|nr:hypothetical protein [Actinomycetota bacterium]
MASTRKPHNDVPGYVCELKATMGGHAVIYDRQRGADWIDAEYRWIVMHEPSTKHVAISSLSHARSIMKGWARSTTIEEACMHADILEEDYAAA